MAQAILVVAQPILFRTAYTMARSPLVVTLLLLAFITIPTTPICGVQLAGEYEDPDEASPEAPLAWTF